MSTVTTMMMLVAMGLFGRVSLAVVGCVGVINSNILPCAPSSLRPCFLLNRAAFGPLILPGCTLSWVDPDDFDSAFERCCFRLSRVVLAGYDGSNPDSD